MFCPHSHVSDVISVHSRPPSKLGALLYYFYNKWSVNHNSGLEVDTSINFIPVEVYIFKLAQTKPLTYPQSDHLKLILIGK